MSQSRYIVGIDLGTSNCAVAWAKSASDGRVHDFPVLQVLRDGQAGSQALLPSALYAAPDAELSTLPLPAENGWVAGAYARWRGARVPGRLITSAKSWLCHPGVDRTAAILPWGGAPDVKKISPVEASAALLRRICSSWNNSNPGDPIHEQDVVITVPASFDEAARALTVQAARSAGLEQFTLLEEPQAAFYDFSHRHQRDLAKVLEKVRLVLVIDVGGGTTDLTLVQVAISPEGPLLKRIAVGEHLILGGDNMDAAIARRVEEKLKGKKLSSAQLIQVIQSAREAKETLLGENAPAETKVVIAGEGSKLLGGTLSATLTREEVEALILDGFLPRTGKSEFAAGQKGGARGGIQEMGLPYAADPAIPRHIAGFLARHSEAAFQALGQWPVSDPGQLPRPDAILLNGGVFNSSKIASRLIEAVSNWWPEQTVISLLHHSNLDLAVARGAAAYGLVRHGQGRRISGGTAHSFYVGIATDKGAGEETSAVCLVPRGMEEGETVEVKDRVFKLHVGRPVQFPLYTSTGDQVDRPGDIVKITDEFSSLPPIQTVLKSRRERVERIVVYLRAKLTEIGTVELWCVSAEATEAPETPKAAEAGGRPEQWRLEFDIRAGASEEVSITESLPPRFSEARDYIAKIFGNRPSSIQHGPKDVKHLWSALEQLLGPRESWSLPVLRQLWGELYAGAGKRRRSADHEKIFFQLLGYTLRPGFGYSLDEWRCEQTFKIFPELIEFHKEKPNWNEFWILWRRISGGLSSERQEEFWNYVKPHLATRIPAKPPKNSARPKGPNPEGAEEMLRAAAAMEHVNPGDKAWLGNLVLDRLRELHPAGGPWAWSLGRLGGRVPLYGSAHTVVPPEQVRNWLDFLVVETKLDGRVFALSQIARKTGDRLRDIDENMRRIVVEALERAAASNGLVEPVRQTVELKSVDESKAFGDALPIGLELRSARTSAF